MSSVVVITSIIVILSVLVCYTFVTQTLALKEQQRERLMTALTAKVRNFKFMLNGFPVGFLPKDLLMLVQRSLIDIYEQLVDIDSGNTHHSQELQAISHQLNETQRQARHYQPVTMENPQQIKDAKACLDELHKFVYSLESKGVLNRSNAETYRAMIKQLVLQITVDSYLAQGRHAKGAGKTRLALHYFSLAHKLLGKEGRNNQQEKIFIQLAITIQELEAGLQLAEPGAALGHSASSANAETDAEWNKFKPEDIAWKKKQIYD